MSSILIPATKKETRESLFFVVHNIFDDAVLLLVGVEIEGIGDGHGVDIVADYGARVVTANFVQYGIGVETSAKIAYLDFETRLVESDIHLLVGEGVLDVVAQFEGTPLRVGTRQRCHLYAVALSGMVVLVILLVSLDESGDPRVAHNFHCPTTLGMDAAQWGNEQERKCNDLNYMKSVLLHDDILLC